MSTNTANYNLVKPDGNPGGDLVDINVINSNMDIVDAALHAHDLSIAADAAAEDARLDALEAKIGNHKFFVPVVKAADESVISSIALQDDNELLIAIPGAGTYVIDLDLIITGPAAGDMRIGASFPAGTCRMLPDSLDNTLAATSGPISRQTVMIVSGVDPGVGIGTNVSDVYAHIRFFLFATAAGVFTFRWAQSVSTATNTIIRAGSMLRMEQVA